jgi:hypothetical protein
MTMLSGVLALAALLCPSGAEGQQVRLIHPDGRVRADEGGWRAPTPADALRVLREDLGVRSSPSRVAEAVLRQVHEPRSPGELDALADALAEILVAGGAEYFSEEYRMQDESLSALYAAAMRAPEAPGTPHEGSFGALVRVYESLAARSLADQGTDPFRETYRPAGEWQASYSYLRRALRSIFRVRPRTEGGDYVLALFEAAEPPEPYTHNGFVPSVWCEAGELLRGPSSVWQLPDGRMKEEPVPNPKWPGRMSELPEIARDPREFLSRCNRVGNMSRVRN